MRYEMSSEALNRMAGKILPARDFGHKKKTLIPYCERKIQSVRWPELFIGLWSGEALFWYITRWVNIWMTCTNVRKNNEPRVSLAPRFFRTGKKIHDKNVKACMFQISLSQKEKQLVLFRCMVTIWKCYARWRIDFKYHKMSLIIILIYSNLFQNKQIGSNRNSQLLS